MSHDKECKCKEMSCTATCERKHTCHTYSCDECAPKQDWEEWKKQLFDELKSSHMLYSRLDELISQLLAEAREDCIRTSNSGRKMYEIGAKEERKRVVTELEEEITRLLNKYTRYPVMMANEKAYNKGLEVRRFATDLLAYIYSLKKK